MKRVLFVIPTLTNGGAERVASIIANALCKQYEVRFFLLEQDSQIGYELESIIKVQSAKVHVQKRGNKLRAIYCYFKNFFSQYALLKNDISEYAPDVVVSFLPKADMLTYWAKRKMNFKWISSERNDPSERTMIERFALAHIYKKTDGFVCQSNVVAKYYKTKGVKNCTVIPNPKNNGVVLNENVPYDNFAIAVGRFDYQKNYKMLIKAFVKAVQNVGCKTKLIILGDGPLYKENLKLVNQLNASNQVVLLGRKHNVGDYLRKASFFVMSSNYEGMPNALIEAMDAGLPVICTDFYSGTARELITEKNGYLVTVGDEVSMTKSIEKMLVFSYAELKEMGLFSKKKVAHMSLNSVCNQWNSFLMNVSLSK